MLFLLKPRRFKNPQMATIGSFGSRFFELFADICELVTGLAIVIGSICLIFGIFTIRNNPSGVAASYDQKRHVGYEFSIGGLVFIAIGLIASCCAYQLQFVNCCVEKEYDTSGGDQQVIVVHNTPQPTPLPPTPQVVPQNSQLIPTPQPSPRPVQQPFEQEYVSPHQLSQFLPVPQLGLEQSSQLFFPPLEPKYVSIPDPTFNPHQEQFTSGLYIQQTYSLEHSYEKSSQQPPSYEQYSEMSSVPPPDDNY
ncbi:hypothetical protein ACTXT7_016209 [Hymenolepis weldensis]